MTRKLLTAFALSLTIGFGFAQNLKVNGPANKATLPNQSGAPAHRTCGSVNPGDQWEQEFQRLIELKKQDELVNGKTNATYVIPVIIHVIHGGQAVGTYPNISNAQAVSQINVLNADFAGTGLNNGNVPSVFAAAKANCDISFCLAQQDPSGNQLTEIGVHRFNYNSLTTSGAKNPADASYNTPSTFQTFINSVVKPQTIWDPTKYMNIWVTDENSATGLLGFATFPAASGLTGIPGSTGTSTTDGLWCWGKCFGNTGTLAAPYNKGRTATHEIGHWLGLRHIWGDGTCATDYCNDTPVQQQENYSCPTHPYNVGGCSGNTTGEMFMNFMDYTDDACMYMFTNDQRTRMQTAMANGTYRKFLNTSGKCNPVNPNQPPVADFTGTPTTIAAGGTVTFTNASTGTGNTYSWSANPSAGVTWNTSTSTNPTATFANPGTYDISLVATNANGNNTKTQTAYITVNASTGGCDTLDNSEPNDTLSAYLLGTWGYYPGNNSYNLSYAEKFTNTTVGTLSEFYVGVLQADQRSASKQITWKVYSVNGSGLPGTVLANGTKSVLYSSLTAGQFNTITFSPAVNITGDFFIAMELPTASNPQDTVIIGLNYNTGNPGHAVNSSYIKYNGTWYDAPSLLAGLGNTAYSIIATVCPNTPNAITKSVANLENNINVFPNPSTGLLNILLSFDRTTDATVTITNLLGEVVNTNTYKAINAKNITVDMSDNAKGTYFVNVKTNEGTVTKKVILAN